MATRANVVIGGTVAGALLAAAALIRPWEGLELEPYRDIVGVLTVCYGDTSAVERRKYTAEECEQRLNSDLGRRLAEITQCINVKLHENEWAAVLSWSYNVGTQAACRSTLVRKINEGQPPSIWCAELDKWVYADGKRVKGLVNRRTDERAMCEGRL